MTELGSADPGETDRNKGGTRRALVYVTAPTAVLAMGLFVGYLKFQEHSTVVPPGAAAASVAAATEATTAMLSYRADHVETDLHAATDRMTGEFRDEFQKLVDEVVIPGAKESNISAVATVPASGLISGSADHAEVLVYINQTTTVGTEPSTDTRSSAHVDLVKVGDSWLVSDFEPV